MLAKAGTGTETVQVVKEQRPDVLVLDLFMPEGDGFKVLRDFALTFDQKNRRMKLEHK